jgi:hypothetical protein
MQLTETELKPLLKPVDAAKLLAISLRSLWRLTASGD